MIYRTALLSLLASLALPVIAGESNMEREFEALRTYCRPDIERLCAGIEPGEGRIKKCLGEHKKEVSVGCAEALQKLKEK